MSNTLTPEDAFNMHAEGADGLTKEQVRTALFHIGHNPTKEDIDTFWTVKGKEDDLLTLTELTELHESLGDPVDVLQKAFQVFDIDGNGSISRDELKGILDQVVDPESGFADEEMLDMIFKDADTDRNKDIDFKEFIKMIQSGMAGISADDVAQSQDA